MVLIKRFEVNVKFVLKFFTIFDIVIVLATR